MRTEQENGEDPNEEDVRSDGRRRYGVHDRGGFTRERPRPLDEGLDGSCAGIRWWPPSSHRAERYDGALDADDDRYPAGEFFDTYPVDAIAGEVLTVDLRSESFDTYLVVETPSGTFLTDDDHEDDRHRSRLEVAAPETGRWMVRVTSFGPGRTGPYTLRLQARAPEGRNLLDPPVEGALAAGDQRLKDARYGNTHVFGVPAGEHVTVALQPANGLHFLLMLFGPAGELLSEDVDYYGGQDRLRMQLKLGSTGEYRVVVTSCRDDEWTLCQAWDTGSYLLSITASPAPPE